MGLESLVTLVIYVCVIGAVCWLLWWLVGFLGLPEPFAKIARGIIAVIGVILLISLLFQLLPSGFPTLKR